MMITKSNQQIIFLLPNCSKISTILTWAEGKDCGLVVFGGWVEELGDKAVGVHRVVVHEFGQRVEFAFRRDVDLSLRVLVDAVVINSALVPQRDASLTWTGFALAHQEAAVDP
jgi:hypothetical protein